MTIVFKLADFDPSALHVMVSPLAELMAILHSMAEPDHHLEARTVLDSVSQSLDEVFWRDFTSLSPLWARFRCRLFFPFTPTPKSIKDELEALRLLPVETFVDLCAEGVRGMRGAIPPMATLLSQTPERKEFLDYCLSRSSERYDLAVALLDDPEAVRLRLLKFLDEANDRFFRREWRIVCDEIVHAARVHEQQARTLNSAEALSRLHHSARHFPEQQEIRFDKLQRYSVRLEGRTVIAVPSVRIGSHLIIKWEPGMPVIIHFPLRVASSGPLGIDAMRQRLAALNSDSRMELFRHLVGEPITTSELASRMDQTAAQVSRELRVLRDAGLLVSERRGKRVFHRVDIDKVINLGPDLLSIVLR